MGKKRPAEVRIRAFANDIEKLLPVIRTNKQNAILVSDATAEDQIEQIQELRKAYDAAYSGLENIRDFVNGE